MAMALVGFIVWYGFMVSLVWFGLVMFGLVWYGLVSLKLNFLLSAHLIGGSAPTGTREKLQLSYFLADMIIDQVY